MNTFTTHVISRMLAFVLVAAAALPNFARADELPENRDISISYVVNPVYPIKLGAMGISEGSVRIIISVDNTGKMMDWVALSATKPEFVRAIANVINSWEFKPACRDGEPVASVISVAVKFKNDNVVMSMNGFQMVQALMNSYFDAKELSLVARYSELDGIPEPINIVQPSVDPSVTGKAREGEVVIGFFIDTDGHVRIPVMMECKGDVRLANAAYDALNKWEFAKPVVKGKPTMVRASQKFIFKEAVK